MEERMKTLEERVDTLEHELRVCGLDKDERIAAVHNDMADLKSTVQALTEEVRDAVFSLRRIAENTTTMKELTDLYTKWKGFVWVIKSVGFWVSIATAFIIGVVTTLMNH